MEFKRLPRTVWGNFLVYTWKQFFIYLSLFFFHYSVNSTCFQDSNLLLEKAHQHYFSQNYDSALISVRSISESEDIFLRAKIDLLTGEILRGKGDLDSASYYLLSARELARRNKFDSISILSNIQLGSVYGMLGRLELSREHFEEASIKSIHIGDTTNWSRSLMGLGNLAYLQGDYNRALEEFQTAIPIFRSNNNQSQLASTLLNLSNLHRELNQSEEALMAINESIAAFSQLGDTLSIAHGYHNKGLILLDRTDNAAALNAYQASLRMATLANSKFDMEKAWFGIAMSHGALGNYKQAFSFLNQYLGSHDAPDFQMIEDTYNIKYEDTVRFWRERLTSMNTTLLNTRLISMTIVVVLIMVILMIRRRQKQRLALLKKNQQLANQKINDLLQQQEINSLQGVLAGQEKERQRIATDLHDKLGAILGMVKLHFSAVEERIDVLRDDNKKQYDKANELLDQASTEVRNISHNLLSGVLVKFGLVPALQDLKDTVEATGKLKVQLVTGEQTSGRLSGEQELQIYRIVQELISNILKHAKATEAVVQLNRTNGEINLIVEDNGIGFDVASARQKQGIGLKNLEARAAKLNAKLHFDSGKGAGTTVSVDIPLNSGDL